MVEYDTSIVQDEDIIVVSPRLKIDDTDALKYIHIDQESVKNVQDSMEITSRPTWALVCMCVRPCMHRKHEALVSHVCGDILGGVQFEPAKESTCNIDQFQFGPEINEFTCIHGRLVMYAANHKQGVIKIYKFHLVRPPDKEAYSWTTMKIRDLFSLKGTGWGPPVNCRSHQHQITSRTSCFCFLRFSQVGCYGQVCFPFWFRGAVSLLVKPCTGQLYYYK